MRRDRQGFDYPVANPDLCIECGKCESICPVLNPRQTAAELAAYAARVPEYMDESSSGGVFSYLARQTVDSEGVVFGAVMNPDMTVGHSEAETMDQVSAMRGSKYVQSDMYSSFEDARAYLEEGRKVLFTGTPCQIAGFKAYLGKEYEGLLTADIACHGVPGPGLWQKYVEALSLRSGSAVTDVRFRDKISGWRRYSFSYTVGGKKFSVPYTKDPYMALFVQDMTLRPSCYDCPARGGISGSDLTLADLWNVAETVPQMDDDKGVSLVLANTDKGIKALEDMDMVKVDAGVAKRMNSGFATTIQCPERREEFFKGVHSSADLPKYMASFVVKKPLHVRIYRSVRRMLSVLKRRIKK
jgi:ferredoxin